MLRLKAEVRLDTNAVESLRVHYPEIFTNDFQELIEKLKIVACDLDHKSDENFSEMFTIGSNNKQNCLN